MVTRDKRLETFNSGAKPPDSTPVEVLCEDKSGTYTTPFACRWLDDAWRNADTGDIISATVLGWRPYG